MDKHIIDGMKNEGKPIRTATIITYFFAVFYPLVMYLTKNIETIKDALLIFLAFFIMGSYGLYGWLYSLKYKLEITQEKITVKTLFRKFEINIKDITSYTYKRYRKTVFYKFKLFAKEKGLLISTRYKDELIEILKENNIFEKQV